MHGMRHVRATLALTRVNASYRAGRLSSAEKLSKALVTVDRAIAALDQLPADLERLEHTALAYQLEAYLQFATGDVDAGLEAAIRAGDLFETAGGTSESYGRFLHDFALHLDELTVPELPLQYARRAAEVLAPYGDRYRRETEALVQSLEEGTSVAPHRRIEQLRLAAATAPRKDRAAPAQELAIALIFSGEADKHLDEIHATMKRAFEAAMTERRRHGVDRPVATLELSIELHWRRLALPSWMPAALDALLKEVRGVGRRDLEPQILTLQAVWLLHGGRRREGLQKAVEAVARHDEMTVLRESSIVRMLTGRVNDYARVFALEAAVDEGEAELVAELVESARLQVEPAEGDHPHRVGMPASRVARLRRISVAGTTRLGGGGAGGTVLPLEVAIERVGGNGAVWWGTWSANERMFWALRLHGEWHCGVLSLSEGEPLHGLLVTAWTTSPLSPDAGAAEILAGPWCATADDEESFSLELGSRLIPPQLRSALDDALFDDSPISLVVSGNLLAMLPTALLAFADADGETRRVLEAAVVRVAPPAVLVERTKVQAVGAEFHPLHVACVDPRDDLAHSREPPPGARIVLGGDPHDRDGEATLARLAEELGRLSPGQPGLFYYSGHAVADGLGGDDRDALALAGEDMLSAHDMFAGTVPVAMPARVMLSACSSAGAAGSGGGEWLGLTAAALWRGASQVVATNWPIWDTPFTADFDHRLAGRLQRSPDAATALRDLQLATLAEWRVSGHDLSGHEEPGVPLSARELAFPLIWGAYACVGVLA